MATSDITDKKKESLNKVDIQLYFDGKSVEHFMNGCVETKVRIAARI
jgi:hypothetical protein